jgi:hypothetical protein
MNDDYELFRTTVEKNVRRQCHGQCHVCGSPYGGPDLPYKEWEDLASWVFGYCTNRCRRAAGEPAEFDIDAAMKVLFPHPS